MDIYGGETMNDYRKSIHKYILVANCLKKIFYDGEMTEAEFYYFEEIVRITYGIPEKSVFRIYID